MDWSQIDEQLAPLVAMVAIVGTAIALLYHFAQYRKLLRDNAENERQRIERGVKRQAEIEAMKKEIADHIEETRPIMMRFFQLETQFAVMAESNKQASENVKNLSQLTIETQKNIGRLLEVLLNKNKGG